jgi:uncharacterized protein DUF551
MNWEPIETAPKDGTDVILFDGFAVSVGAYEDDMSYEDFLTICGDGEGEKEWRKYIKDEPGQGWISHETISGDCVLMEPTHWMPLPSPPSKEKKTVASDVAEKILEEHPNAVELLSRHFNGK